MFLLAQTRPMKRLAYEGPAPIPLQKQVRTARSICFSIAGRGPARASSWQVSISSGSLKGETKAPRQNKLMEVCGTP